MKKIDRIEELLQREPPGQPSSHPPLILPSNGLSTRAYVRSAGLPTAGSLALVVVLVVLVAAAVRISSSPSEPASGAHDAGQTAAAPSAPASSPSPTPVTSPSTEASPTPSSSSISVTLHLDANHALALTVTDQSGRLIGAREAEGDELDAPDMQAANADIFAYLQGADETRAEVAVVWIGTICDQAAEVVVEPDVDAITVHAPASPPCDAMAVGRGVVLTFDQPVDVSVIRLSLVHD